MYRELVLGHNMEEGSSLGQFLTHKHLETYVSILTTVVATDALVLKHQTISTHCADWIYIAFNPTSFIENYYI